MTSAAQMDRAAVAARFGIKPRSVTIAVARGSLPPPDGYFGRSPWWWSTTLDNWKRPSERTMKPAPTKGG